MHFSRFFDAIHKKQAARNAARNFGEQEIQGAGSEIFLWNA